jgi:hypothetical protein
MHPARKFIGRNRNEGALGSANTGQRSGKKFRGAETADKRGWKLVGHKKAKKSQN